MSPTRNLVSHVGILLTLLALAAPQADARGGRGGGGFHGGGMSMGRGGGYSGTFSRGGSYSRPSGTYSRPSGDRRPNASRPGQGGSGTRWADQGPSRPGQGGSGTHWTDQRPTRPGQGGSGTQREIGNRDININNDIDIDNDGDWGGWRDHPIAAGIAIGAVAGMTAAAIGSAFYALPRGCAPYPYYSYTYYSCGSAWYQPQYEGDTVVYVTVPDPKTSPPPSGE